MFFELIIEHVKSVVNGNIFRSFVQIEKILCLISHRNIDIRDSN